MSEHNQPKALTMYEAWQQFGAALFDLFAAMVSWWPSLADTFHDHANLSLASAVQSWADVVGYHQATHDYFAEGSG